MKGERRTLWDPLSQAREESGKEEGFLLAFNGVHAFPFFPFFLFFLCEKLET